MSVQVGTGTGPAVGVAQSDIKLEAVVIPVADVDRSRRFYESLGWRLDADFAFDNGFRVVQLTPPGSPCSVQFGTRMTPAPAGSAQGLYLIVSDIDAARRELVASGAAVSEIFHAGTPGAQFQAEGSIGQVPGRAPDGASYSTFATFHDPDGNGWLIQEVRTRLAGRGLAHDLVTFTELLREAEAQHGQHSAEAPPHHWSEWYAAYVLGRERGRTQEESIADARLHVEQVHR